MGQVILLFMFASSKGGTATWMLTFKEVVLYMKQMSLKTC